MTDTGQEAEAARTRVRVLVCGVVGVDVRVSVPIVVVTHLRTPFAAMWTRSPYGAIMCV